MTSTPTISSREITGTSVFDDGGKKLGSVVALKIDKRSGVIRYALLEFGGILGIGAQCHPVPWPLLTYVEMLGGYLAPLTKRQLENAPSFLFAEVPMYSDAFGHMLYAHHGVDWTD